MTLCISAILQGRPHVHKSPWKKELIYLMERIDADVQIQESIENY